MGAVIIDCILVSTSERDSSASDEWLGESARKNLNQRNGKKKRRRARMVRKKRKTKRYMRSRRHRDSGIFSNFSMVVIADLVIVDLSDEHMGGSGEEDPQVSKLNLIRQRMADMKESHRRQMDEMDSLIKSTMMPHTSSELSGGVAGASSSLRSSHERRRESSRDDAARGLGLTLSSLLNPVSLAWSQVGQCIAAEGEDIQITDYEV